MNYLKSTLLWPSVPYIHKVGNLPENTLFPRSRIYAIIEGIRNHAGIYGGTNENYRSCGDNTIVDRTVNPCMGKICKGNASVLLRPKNEEKGWGESYSSMELKTIQSTNWQSTNKIRLRKAFMSIWGFMFTSGQTMTNKVIPIRFYT